MRLVSAGQQMGSRNWLLFFVINSPIWNQWGSDVALPGSVNAVTMATFDTGTVVEQNGKVWNWLFPELFVVTYLRKACFSGRRCINSRLPTGLQWYSDSLWLTYQPTVYMSLWSIYIDWCVCQVLHGWWEHVISWSLYKTCNSYSSHLVQIRVAKHLVKLLVWCYK